MTRSWPVASSLLVGAALTVCSWPVHATQAKPPQAQAPPAPAATPAAVPESNWITRCTSKTRAGALECTIEQSIVKTDTHQVVVLFRIRIPADTRVPVMMTQLPLGLYLPANVTVHVDDRKVSDLPVQTCDASGCYVSGPLPADLLTQLSTGKLLRFSFQNLARETINVSMPLGSFAAAYESIR